MKLPSENFLNVSTSLTSLLCKKTSFCRLSAIVPQTSCESVLSTVFYHLELIIITPYPYYQLKSNQTTQPTNNEIAKQNCQTRLTRKPFFLLLVKQGNQVPVKIVYVCSSYSAVEQEFRSEGFWPSAIHNLRSYVLFLGETSVVVESFKSFKKA